MKDASQIYKEFAESTENGTVRTLRNELLKKQLADLASGRWKYTSQEASIRECFEANSEFLKAWNAISGGGVFSKYFWRNGLISMLLRKRSEYG